MATTIPIGKNRAITLHFEYGDDEQTLHVVGFSDSTWGSVT